MNEMIFRVEYYLHLQQSKLASWDFPNQQPRITRISVVSWSRYLGGRVMRDDAK